MKTIAVGTYDFIYTLLFGPMLPVLHEEDSSNARGALEL